MADPRRRNERDRGGAWFVDTTCIDCDVARQLAPGLIEEDEQGLSYFVREPKTPRETSAAWRALLACPSGSIGAPRALRAPQGAFPWEVAPGVFLAGYHSRDSFGAHAYFVPAPEGNFLVDAPRFVPALVDAFAAQGGLRHILLTHRDDVADADRYAARFGARVWIHRADADAAPYATDVFDEEADVEPGLRAIPFAGHTRGSSLYLWRSRFLFTGDSLAFSRRTKDLYAFRDATWFSWDALTHSMERLRDLPFEWVLPGHGSVGRVPLSERQARVEALVERMRRGNASTAW